MRSFVVSSLLSAACLLPLAQTFMVKINHPSRSSCLPTSSHLTRSSPFVVRLQGVLSVGEVLATKEDTLKVTRVRVEDEEKNICSYLVEAEVYGPDVKKAYQVALNGARMNAAYPGYRKGVVPPQQLAGVKLNAVTAAIMDVCRTAMDLHGLENFPLRERSVRMKVPQTMEELAKKYEIGKDLKFQAEIDAIGVPSGADAPPSPPASASV